MPTYKIELVGPDTDLKSLLDIGEEAIKAIPFLKISPQSKQVMEVLTSMATGDFQEQAMFVLKYSDKPVGFIMGTVASQHPIFGNDKVVYEIAWYVTSEHRGNPESMKLKAQYEDWARLIGAKAVFMACFDNDIGKKLQELYISEGYKRAEFTFIKEL